MKGKTEYTYCSVRLLLIALIILTGFLTAPAVHAFTVINGVDASGPCNNQNQANDNLRKAICYANANSGTTLDLQAGSIYTLTDNTQGGADDNNGGDLDIWATNLTINGNGAIIRMTLNDRVIDVLSGAAGLTINNVIIQGANCSGYGGGIENYGTGTSLNNVTIRNNRCDWGGGIANRQGTMNIRNSTISGNSTAGGDGGGVLNLSTSASAMTVINSTISGNNGGDDGGGFQSNDGTVRIYSSTIANNQAGNGGGGLRWAGGTVFLKNTIIAGNTAGDNRYPDLNGTLSSEGYNLIGNLGSQTYTAQGTDLVNVNPLLGSLGNNGGSTFTHALPTGSPALDVGSCDYSADQRGSPRTSPCDIGAFELTGLILTFASPSVNENGTVVARITRTDTSGDLVLTLSSSDTGEATVPLTVTIPNGSTYVEFDVTGVDDGLVDGLQTVTITAQGGIYITSADIDVLDGNMATTFSIDPLIIREGDPATLVQLCINPKSLNPLSFALSAAPAGEITIFPSSVNMPSLNSCASFNVTAVDDGDEETNEDIIITATETSSEGYPDATMTVTVQDNDTPYLMITAPASISEGDTAVIVTVTRSETTGVATIRLTTADRTALSLTGGINGAGTTQYRDIVLADGVAAATFQINGVDDGDMDDELVLLTANGTYVTGTFEDVTANVEVLDDDLFYGASDGLSSQTFPTALFIASYDWLTGFYDYNNEGRDTTDAAGHNNDPDTDNFNKIILKDSNLFPLVTATLNDVEFPNITSRNTDRLNDYINRSVAVVPNYINTTTAIPYFDDRDDIKAVGMRSHLSWVFVTDPANHNLRRYQFEPHDGFYEKLDINATTFGDDVVDAGDVCDEDSTGIDTTDCSHSTKGNCCNEGPGCGADTWNQMVFIGEVSKIFNVNEQGLANELTNDGIDHVLFMCRKPNTYPTTANTLLSSTYQDGRGILDFFVTVTDQQIASFNAEGFIPISYRAAATDSSSLGVFVSINGKCFDTSCSSRDPGPSSTTNLWQQADDVLYRDVDTFNHEYSLSGLGTVDASWDADATTPGIQLRLGITAEQHGGLVIAFGAIGFEHRQDRGFGVSLPGDQLYYEYTEEEKEARWNNIDTFLETVPRQSYPGYDMFTSGLGEKIAYGYSTNTSFETADNVRFKNPRDVDAFRDYFDIKNEGPVYIFVADTMNSRIQVFMNATASAGNTGAPFPIRPVRVKGPNDTGALAYAGYSSNELAMRTGNGVFGDGRKSDWRPFLPNYASGGMTFMNVSTGKGEFFYPHGVAVDQDPDTEDVYLFVADTFNHRIQVFRSATSLANQPIIDKRFNFEFEAGWGAYPLQTTATLTPPGPYGYRYPKGIDVARFANNSSYLYVVDSKNYRLMKYLITESGSGGFQSISAVAGYGYDGTSYSKSLLNNAGVPLTSQTSTAAGFLNPQDVATGYNGFFGYSSRGGIGWKFLNNYMVYVTDYARNDNLDHGSTANWQNRLNMRVMQFIDGFPNTTALDGVYLPWATESVTFGSRDNLGLEQSIFGSRNGRYDSRGISTTSYTARPGPPENAGVDDVFTERPLGIATLAWNTIEPIDMRVVHRTNDIVYANGATIPLNTNITVGAASGKFFAFPEISSAAYTAYTGLPLDGRRVGRVHIFWYNNDGSYRAHQSVSNTPYEFNSGATSGYMKVIAEDTDFGYSGRSGTQIFRIK